MMIIALLLSSLLAVGMPSAKPERTPDMPPVLEVCGGVTTHVQGVALNPEKGELYFSFTTRFIRTDLHGRVLGSIDRIQGHLGAMTFNPEDGCVYASLECKDDEIGRGVAKSLGAEVVSRSHFYIAIIDVAKVDRIGIDPEGDPVLRTVCLSEPALDYYAQVPLQRELVLPAEGKASGHETGLLEHRYGCAGIDGVSFGPLPGRKRHVYDNLYVACGVYGDVTRSDNDHQIILRYRTSALRRYARAISFGTLHESGPAKPSRKNFVRTGNTTYGVQNMAFDPSTRHLFMAVYRGKKTQFPNYSLFAIDLSKTAFKAPLAGVPYEKGKVSQLHLSGDGLLHESSGIHGWNFRWGTTGMIPRGDGCWLFSEPYRDPDGMQCCRLHLLRWTGDPADPFATVVDNE